MDEAVWVAEGDMMLPDTSAPPPAAEFPSAPTRPSSYRRLLEVGCLVVSGLLLFRAVCAEPYEVPTGSMAPALLGHHRSTTCPKCGYPIDVGLGGHERDVAVCPNCGCEDVSLADCPVVAGDHVLVNKNVFDWRRPRRWEMAVFRSPLEPTRTFVKRVVGLPGETVQVADGDVYRFGKLARKSLAELKTLRIPLCDYNFRPSPGGWAYRWEARGAGASVQDQYLELAAAGDPERYQWLVYRNSRPGSAKAQPMLDEYSYDGRDGGAGEPVHDFQVECDLEVRGGDGWVALGITDGHDDLLAELPVGALKEGTRLREVPPEPAARTAGRGRSAAVLEHTTRPGPDGVDGGGLLQAAPGFGLMAGRTYHVELAFVDRRLTLAVDGLCPFEAVDQQAVAERGEVARPVRLGARGADVRVHNFRLYRDVHYTASGRHGVRAPVRLGAGEYFVLGDNSPSSDDSRFWSDAEGRPVPVPEANLLGKPFLVHMPSRRVEWDALGRHWQYQGLDWGRVRWLR
jgi:signal peptidase I